MHKYDSKAFLICISNQIHLLKI